MSILDTAKALLSVLPLDALLAQKLREQLVDERRRPEGFGRAIWQEARMMRRRSSKTCWTSVFRVATAPRLQFLGGGRRGRIQKLHNLTVY